MALVIWSLTSEQRLLRSIARGPEKIFFSLAHGCDAFFAQLSSYKLESSLQVMKILALLMLKQAGGAKKASHPIHFHLVFAICLLYSTVVTRLRVD